MYVHTFPLYFPQNESFSIIFSLEFTENSNSKSFLVFGAIFNGKSCAEGKTMKEKAQPRKP